MTGPSSKRFWALPRKARGLLSRRSSGFRGTTCRYIVSCDRLSVSLRGRRGRRTLTGRGIYFWIFLNFFVFRGFWLLASVASGFCGFWLLWLLAFVAFGFRGFCGFWLLWLLAFWPIHLSVYTYLFIYLSFFWQLFSFLFLYLLFLLFSLQGRNQTRKQASKHELLTFGSGVLLGGALRPPPTPPRHEICTSSPTPAPATKSIF